MLHIKVVGPGCANCARLANLCQEVIEENGLEGQLEKITDMERFAELGVMLTPALIVNDQLLSSGKIPTRHTLADWLGKQAKNAG